MLKAMVNLGKKTGVALAAAGLMASCVAMPAYAADYTDRDLANIPTTAQATNTLTVTGAATRAAMPALEILGINSVEESGQFVDTTDWYKWTQPKYFLAASGFNASLSPYLANLASGQTDDTLDANGAKVAQAAAFNASRNGAGGGPDGALAAYGTDATDDAVWNLLPDVIVGDGSGVNYNADGYKPDVQGYAPTGVNYAIISYGDLIDSMDRIAEAAEQYGQGRYGDITDIAQAYEEYVWGTMGAVQQAIDEGDVDYASVALVTNATRVGTDEQGTPIYEYTLLTSAESGAGDGTAASNRYLETTSDSGVFDLADNYGNTKSTAVTAEELRNNVQLIMVGGQQSSSNYAAIEQALVDDGLLDMTYLVQNNGSQGSMYGVVMNSVENAQNVGRILGCLYPEVIDQSDFVAYYYDMFYHIDSANLNYVVGEAMDGVRNWDASSTGNADAATSWENTSVADYSRSDVQSIIDAGYDYYLENYA